VWLQATVVELTSDACLGLASPSIEAMNCQPGNPVAFLTLMWNVSRNRMYFLNHPLNEDPDATSPQSANGSPRQQRIRYLPHEAPAPGATYRLEVEAPSGRLRGFRDGQLYVEMAPLSDAMRHGLGAFRFGVALSGSDDRLRLSASFPLRVEALQAKDDTLALGRTRAEARVPSNYHYGAAFHTVDVSVESILPRFKLEAKYVGASKRRQRIDINDTYPGLRQIHSDPDIFEVDDFLTREECELLQVGCKLWRAVSGGVVGFGGWAEHRRNARDLSEQISLVYITYLVSDGLRCCVAVRLDCANAEYACFRTRT
jgi:hypothetical protein